MAWASPWIRRAIRIGGTALALAWIAHRLDGAALVDALGQFPAWAFLIPTIGLLINTLNQALRISWVLSRLGHVLPFRVVLSCLMRGAFIGLTLPAGGGEIAKTALIARAGPGMHAAVSTLIAVRLTQLPSWILVLCWGLTISAYTATPVLMVAAVTFSAIATALLLIVGMGQLPWRDTWPWSEEVNRWRSSFRTIKGQGGLLTALVALGVIAALVNSAIVWALLLAVGTPIPFAIVLALIPAADVLIWLPISVGGVGVRESVFALALTPWGVSAPSAVAIGIVRWTGELARGTIGCMLLALGEGRPCAVEGEHPEGEVRDE